MHGTYDGSTEAGADSPLVSVITVCRNSEGTIRKAIESVLTQSYAPLEYIVVDGASSDRTAEIIAEFESRFDGRMRWVSEPDAGIYDAMNKGVHMATGVYVAFVNSDDWYLEHGIATLVAAITSGAGSDISYGGMIRPPAALGGVERTVAPGEMTVAPLMRAMPACHEAILFRRSLHDRFGDYSLEYPVAADYEFVLRCLAGGATTMRADAPIVHFEQGGTSDLDPAAVEREYARVRVKYGANRAAEWLRSERSILNGRVYRVLGDAPLVGPRVKAAYERREPLDR